MSSVSAQVRSTLIGIVPRAIRRRIQTSASLRKIISNSSWLFGDRVLRMGVGLVVGVWVARYLGPEQFGLLNYSVTLVALLAAVSSLGLDQVVVRDIVADPRTATETIATAFVLKALGGIATVVLAVGTVAILRPGDALVSWLVGIAAVGTVFQAFDAIDLWFQSQVQSKYTVLAKNTAFAAASLGRIAMILTQAPLIAFALLSLTEIGLGAAGLVFYYHRSGNALRAWQSRLSRAKSLLRDSWPLILTSAAVAVYMKANSLILAELMGTEALGMYSAATRVSEVLYVIPTAIVSSVYPSVVDAKHTSDTLYTRRLGQLFSLMAGLGYAIAIPVALLAPLLITTLYGQAFLDAAPMLAIHVLAAPFVFLGVALSVWFVTESLAKLYLQRTIVSACVAVVIGILTIPTLSGVGAALAALVSQLLVAFALNVTDERTRRIFAIQARALLVIPTIRDSM